jgi:flavin reductase (DIM6/NTAB) family NADH-FMN oxidoreductase RutF
VQEELRDALAALPAGVVVIAARDGGELRGLTASSFTSVSLEPPLVLVCLETFARTRDAVVASGRFTASLLERSQEFVAERFAGRAPRVGPEWTEVPHELRSSGLPTVTGCVAWFECELRALHRAGDHDIAVAAVIAHGRSQGEPLILWDRAYWRMG